jgi:uncharacterized protein (TIRG00374 family)
VKKFFSLRVLLGFAVGAFFLYLAFWKPDIAGLLSGRVGLEQALIGMPRIHLSELGHILAEAKYLYLLPALLMFLTSFYVRAYRWKVFLLPVGNVRFGVAFSSMMIGYMVNNVLPLRMGELFRAYSLGKAGKVSRSSAFATVVVERIFDVLCLLLVLGIILVMFPFPAWIRQSAMITFVGTVVLVVVLLLMMHRTEQFVRLVRKMFGPLGSRIGDQIEHITRQFMVGLEAFRRTENLFLVIVSSLLLWFFYWGCVYCMFYTFEFVTPEFPKIMQSPPLAGLVILAVGTIAIMIPSTPGSVGTYHGVAVLGLSLFDVPADRAMGFALIMHLFNYLPLTLIGLACFWKQNLSFADVRADEELKST